MSWIKEGSVELSGSDTIALFRDDEKKYMKMVVKLFFNKFMAIVKGDYSEVSVEDGDEVYYAYAVSDQAGVEPYKIYKKEKR